MSSSYAWGAYYEEPFERAEEYIETQYKAFNGRFAATTHSDCGAWFVGIRGQELR